MRRIQLYSLIHRRHNRKNAVARSVRRRAARAAVGCGAFGLLGIITCFLVVSLAYASLVDGLPSLSLIPELLDPENGQLMQPTVIYDRSGTQILLTLENPGIPRRALRLDPGQPDHFSAELIRTTIGYLDPYYWQSAGFSLRSLTAPEPQTIAERIVDDLLLWEEPPGLRRTLRMRILAAQLMSTYQHVQVLEWYLNSAGYGHLAYGADSAARLYLGKSAEELSLAESALLVAASQAPALNPLDAPQAAAERQREVLDRLLEQGVITREEYDRAVSEEPKLTQPPAAEDSALSAEAFSRLVVDNLSERFDRERLERGGLRIITSLDYHLQLELACLTRAQLDRLVHQASRVDEPLLPDGNPCQSVRLLPALPPGEPALPEALTASAVVLDPATGQVLAMLGDQTLDGAAGWLSPREPGSTLTPFVALAGFARGMSPANLTWDIPSSLPEELAARTNPDGQFHGPVRLRIALANDYLAAQAQILSQIGAQNVWRLASALGLSSLANEDSPDLLYEGGRVSPLDLAQAYAVFANQGMRSGQRFTPGGDLHPATVLYVEDQSGRVWLDARQPESQAVVSPQLAYLVHHVIGDTTARWPSMGHSNPLEISRPAAAKAGQVADGQQVWTAGYTPQRVAVFWMGLPDGSEHDLRLGIRPVAGLWHALMQYANRDLPVVEWPEPAGISRVEVCDPSGLLPTSACPEVVSEVFLSGSEPSSVDTLYRVFQINQETGRLATVFTPVTLIEEQMFLVVPPQARSWAQMAGLPLPPQEYDAIQPPEPSPDARITSPDLYAYVRGEVAVEGTAAGEGFRFYQLQVGQGLNPQMWLQIGPDGTSPVHDDVLGVWDTQGQDGLYAVRLLVVRDDQQVEMATIQVTVDNTPPLARIPYPIAGQEIELSENRSITFRADVSDAIGIARVAFLVDGRVRGESLQEPYVFTWNASRGKHTLQVIAYDLAGNEGKSEQVEFEVK
ncbi:MAG: hypothetical protein GX491_19025 [Chloroflexi bacterium]|nr:hypothetical protein [Chloroflexota bacterium]